MGRNVKQTQKKLTASRAFSPLLILCTSFSSSAKLVTKKKKKKKKKTVMEAISVCFLVLQFSTTVGVNVVS